MAEGLSPLYPQLRRPTLSSGPHTEQQERNTAHPGQAWGGFWRPSTPRRMQEPGPPHPIEHYRPGGWRPGESGQ